MRSRFPIPRFAILLLATALLALLACAGYSLFLNPEVAFWKRALDVKQAWSARLTAQSGAKTVVFGASSCAFSIDGERLLERHGIPTVNLGFAAGMGLTFITQCALAETRPGDTLIVALEPALLIEPLEPQPFGIQMSYRAGHPEWNAAPWLARPLPKASELQLLRPGGEHLFIMLGKVALRMPMYRYGAQNIHASGWMSTDDRRFQESAEGSPSLGSAALSEDGRKLLLWVRQWADAHQVRVAYSLPWIYAAPEQEAQHRRENLRFLQQVAEILPVLRDPRLGVCVDRKCFADTNMHLTPEAAAARTDRFAGQLKAWDVWQPGQAERAQSEDFLVAPYGGTR